MAGDVADRWERCRLGEVHPLKIRATVGAADGRCQSPVTVLLDQVLEDRTRLGQHQAVVLDRGKLPRRRVLLEGMSWRFECHRRELVRNAELFEQPKDADRAGELRVVELD